MVIKSTIEEIEETIKKYYIKNNILFLDDDIEEETIKEFKKRLIYILNHNTKNKPIKIYISSYGGSMYELLSIYGLIKNAKCKIITIGLGYCMSAAADILLLGKERWAYPGTTIMLHESSSDDGYSKLNEKKIDYDELKRLNDFFIKRIEEVTTLTNVKKLLEKDRYFDTESALKNKIITKIVKWVGGKNGFGEDSKENGTIY